MFQVPGNRPPALPAQSNGSRVAIHPHLQYRDLLPARIAVLLLLEGQLPVPLIQIRIGVFQLQVELHPVVHPVNQVLLQDPVHRDP